MTKHIDFKSHGSAYAYSDFPFGNNQKETTQNKSYTGLV